MIFILRRVITESKSESNTILGNHYGVIDKQANPIEFKQAQDLFCIHQDKVQGFVTDEGGKLIPIYQDSKYYVMLSNGDSFDVLPN